MSIVFHKIPSNALVYRLKLFNFPDYRRERILRIVVLNYKTSFRHVSTRTPWPTPQARQIHQSNNLSEKESRHHRRILPRLLASQSHTPISQDKGFPDSGAQVQPGEFRSPHTTTGKRSANLTQSHFTKELSEFNAQIMGNMPMVEYDGVAEFWFESFDDWKKLWADEEFLATLEGSIL